ncbi:hypothetical protein Tco_1086754, partial [Tanacetum coccineum]
DDEEEDDEEEDDEIEESLDSDSKSKDAEDEGPTAKDEDPVTGDEGLAAGDEGLGMRVESISLGGDKAVLEDQQRAAPVVETAVRSGSVSEPERPERVSALRQPTLTTWIDPEDSIAYIDVSAYPPPAPPAQTLPSPEWSSSSLLVSLAPSIVPLPISSPIIPLIVPSPIALPAMAETEGFLTELGARVEMQRGLICEHTVRLGELSPTLFERYDRDIRELFTRQVRRMYREHLCSMPLVIRRWRTGSYDYRSQRRHVRGDEAVLEGQQWAASVVETAMEPERPERVSALRQPTLTTWIDPDDDRVYIDVPTYPQPAQLVQTPPSPEWSSGLLLVSLAPSIIPSPILSPMISLTIPSPVATPATAEAGGFLTELGARVEMQEGLIYDHTVRLGELSP